MANKLKMSLVSRSSVSLNHFILAGKVEAFDIKIIAKEVTKVEYAVYSIMPRFAEEIQRALTSSAGNSTKRKECRD